MSATRRTACCRLNSPSLPYLVEGENTLAVAVYRFSDGSYLENQDMWFLSGIFREVSLIAMPSVRIQDFALSTEFDADFTNAVLKITAAIQHDSPLEGSLFAGSDAL